MRALAGRHVRCRESAQKASILWPAFARGHRILLLLQCFRRVWQPAIGPHFSHSTSTFPTGWPISRLSAAHPLPSLGQLGKPYCAQYLYWRAVRP